ncbi:hypothetical protein HELRODRAFT_185810 [Helobdella robusta]|uniref:Reticulocalbin-3 n=1 Tax=Helobdella robusta TaxID=6412 RepID=T1FNB6_HELRO|nr:hypothetical protein HELRODRAFT_185810 [Helobdella robusta]ESN99878.1 hypothetical protein HELRODRAFT_185810 [Helobdella robusta]
MKRMLKRYICCLSLTLLHLTLAAIIDQSQNTRGPDKNHEKHFVEDEHGQLHHNPQFDREAFLGKESAKSFDQLTPEESKEKLKLIVEKIDTDKDGYVDKAELTTWIEHAEQVYIKMNINKQWKDYQRTDDSNIKLSWKQYKERMYGSEDAVPDVMGLPNDYREMLRKDERRWKRADVDGDGELSKDEFKAFIHPEEFQHTADLAGIETMEDVDKNKDGKVTIEEYIGDLWPRSTEEDEDDEEEPDWVRKERTYFAEHRDQNKDGFMDLEEVQEWISPKDFNNAAVESEHLINEADQDQDGKLTMSEILDNYSIFVGSQATDYGEALVRHDEF